GEGDYRGVAMFRSRLVAGMIGCCLAVGAALAGTAEPSAAARGERALLGRSFTHAAWSLQAFENARKVWGDGPTSTEPARYAGAMAVVLLGLREPHLKRRGRRLELGLRDDLCEDTPAWWLLKKKKTMYYTGGTSARSVRSLMQFMLSPLNFGPSITREEATF